jgi:hypothetical protein
MRTSYFTKEAIKNSVFLFSIIVLLSGFLSGCQQQVPSLSFENGNIPGDIPLPIYPGAIQSIESIELTVPNDMTTGVPTTEWRRYITTDELDKVIAWYAQALPDAGFSYKGVRDSGSIFFLTGNWRYGMIVTSIEGKTNFIIAAGHE